MKIKNKLIKGFYFLRLMRIIKYSIKFLISRDKVYTYEILHNIHVQGFINEKIIK